ncbi:Cytochrome P450 [Ophiocordyceps sinensis CO18]|uniref:Cytochrome P450 n=1 Tax=Ophiocordyceps sinensis (strain Co18 / CGMCC 3.14243) TaxID=911162 RepID=T5AKQ7_OPHSC|nr:Cytochrome P450 [Ophiocordyceps sinensis CO18]
MTRLQHLGVYSGLSPNSKAVSDRDSGTRVLDGLVHLRPVLPSACQVSRAQACRLDRGHVVRVGPNKLSFDAAPSSKVINGRSFPKDATYEQRGRATAVGRIRGIEDHAIARNRLAPGFSASALRSHQETIHSLVDLFINQLQKLSEAPESSGVAMGDAFAWLTMDVLGELAFGESFGAVKACNSTSWISRLFSDNWWTTLYPCDGLVNASFASSLLVRLALPKAKVMLEQYGGFVKQEVLRWLQAPDCRGRNALLGILARSGGDVSVDYLIDEGRFLTITGVDTVATMLTAAIHFLDANPTCRDRLIKEIRETFGSYHDVTAGTTSSLSFLQAVIDETLRLFPPVPGGLPRICPGATIDGHYVPKGTVVRTHLFSASRNPETYVLPDDFRPERWLGEPSLQTTDGPPPVFALSQGPFQCIGMTMAHLEMRILLAKLLYSCDFEVLNGRGDITQSGKSWVLWTKPDIKAKFRLVARRERDQTAETE